MELNNHHHVKIYKLENVLKFRESLGSFPDVLLRVLQFNTNQMIQMGLEMRFGPNRNPFKGSDCGFNPDFNVLNQFKCQTAPLRVRLDPFVLDQDQVLHRPGPGTHLVPLQILHVPDASVMGMWLPWRPVSVCEQLQWTVSAPQCLKPELPVRTHESRRWM